MKTYLKHFEGLKGQKYFKEFEFVVQYGTDSEIGYGYTNIKTHLRAELSAFIRASEKRIFNTIVDNQVHAIYITCYFKGSEIFSQAIKLQ